jgi:acetyltransferase
LKDKIYPNSSGDLEQLLPAAGPIGVVSQSGATAFGPLIAKTKDRGSRLKYLVSTGNEAGLEGTDFIRYMLDDPDILTLIAFIEGFKSGEKLKAVADLALEKKKPILVMKMGRSETGGKAAMTHTAAITGSFKVHDGFFRQKGMVRVDDYDELCEVANLFSRRKFPQGNRVGIISHSGGICTLLSDECAENGFEVPSLSGKTTATINEILQGFGSCENPLDLTGAISGPRFPEILRAVIQDANIDAVIVASRGEKPFAQLIADAAQETEKPLLFVWTHSEFDAEGLPALREKGVPVFISPVKGIKALRHLRDYGNFMRRHGDAARDQKKIVERILAEPGIEKIKASLRDESGTSLPEGKCRQILEPLHLPFGPSLICQSSAEAKKAAKTVGYPVVLKVDSPQILHKTESKGVVLNVRGERELISAFGAMKALGKTMDPPLTLNGIMVQKMISGGIELIIGVSEDPLFGPVLLLGWGGVFVEALGLASWRVCPIGPEDARAMIQELPGLSKVLGGMRGRPPLDAQALVDIMVKISVMAYALRDRVTSMDFNPIMVLPEGEGVALVDCRMILRPGQQP